MRLCLATSAENDDAVTATLAEFIGQCTACNAAVVVTLANWVVWLLDQTPSQWQSEMADELAEILDTVASERPG